MKNLLYSWKQPRLFATIFSAFFSIGLAQAEPAMWVIKDNDSTIYLIGTVHLLRHDAEWDKSKVMKTINQSTELWLEVADMDDQADTIPLLTKYGMDPEKALSSKLDAAHKEKLAKVASLYHLPQESFEPMKPWMAGLTVSILPLLTAGYDPNSGVDHVLKAAAEKEGDQIHGFETTEKQVRFLADLSDSDQVEFLNSTLEDAEKGIAQLEKLAKAWMDGDTQVISDLMVNDFKKEAPQIYDKLLVQRNIAWSKQIAEILKRSGVQQIAVGAAHLAGPDSLQVQLNKLGIKAERY
jgi:uncharacterized protein YbaP (TraB family)